MFEDSRDPLEEVLRDETSGPDDPTSHRLLVAVRKGYPLDHVLALLEQQDPRLARVGAWVISELGSRGGEIGDQLFLLLRHEDPYVRYWGCDSAIARSPDLNPDLLAAAASLLLDQVDFVRVAAVHLLAVVPETRIAEAVPKISDDKLRRACRWLANADDHGLQEAADKVMGDDLVLALVGLAALARTDPSGAGVSEVVETTHDPRVESAAKWLLLVRSAWSSAQHP